MNDTIFVNVYYDAQDRIVSKRLKTGDFYMGYYYEYNDKQQIKKEVHFRETNINENKKLFTLGVQTLQSSETFLYTPLTPKQIKKSCLNDVGREYKNAIMNYDARGNQNEISYLYDSGTTLIKSQINRDFKNSSIGIIKYFYTFY